MSVVKRCHTGFPTLEENVQSETSDRVQEAAAQALIARLLVARAGDAERFSVTVNRNLKNDSSCGHDIATILSADGEDAVTITASSGVAAVWGLHHYLKYWCNCHVSWDHRQLQLPRPLPAVDHTLSAVDSVRYYQNVCEYGYSFVWWEWRKWERHIDWMALNGLNLVLAETGQEFVWQKTFERFGMSKKESQSHFTGPAFLPWNRMGNLNRWAGPLPQTWIEGERQLQHRILERIQALGMIPVVPAFAGIVPRRIIELYPDVAHTNLPIWGHFDEQYSGSSLLNLSSPLARQIGRTFLDIYATEYGSTGHLYAVDTFNEMRPVSESTDYVRSYASSVHEILSSFDSRSVWVMQGWLFLDEEYWTEERARALLTAVPRGRMMALDLASTTRQGERRIAYSN
jgi:alpha-N-acetylglucosaminidase